MRVLNTRNPMARRHTPDEIVRNLRQGAQPVHGRRGRKEQCSPRVSHRESLGWYHRLVGAGRSADAAVASLAALSRRGLVRPARQRQPPALAHLHELALFWNVTNGTHGHDRNHMCGGRENPAQASQMDGPNVANDLAGAPGASAP